MLGIRQDHFYLGLLSLNRQEPASRHRREGKGPPYGRTPTPSSLLPTSLRGHGQPCRGSLHLPEAELVPCHPTTPQPGSGGPRDLELPVGAFQVLGWPLRQKGSWHSRGYPSPGVGCEGLSQRPGSLPQAEGPELLHCSPQSRGSDFPRQEADSPGPKGRGASRRGRASWYGNRR